MSQPDQSKPAGCAFLVQPACSEAIFTPEQLTDDHQMFANAAREFMDREVIPRIPELEKDPRSAVGLLRKAGAAGLLMAEIPEAYGGLDLDKVSVSLVIGQLARYGAFGATTGAHTTIGTLPIVYFGTHEQKQRYLPALATGEKIAAYALTEPGSGSDALGAKTTAVLSKDGGHWILNGQKIWITNAGFADVFTVFAKVDGEHFSAFIVDRDLEGVSIGAEERKMGLKGSSTCQVFFEDVHVPVENLLGEQGKGHRIAFNILNLGRLKLGSGAVSLAQETFEIARRYACERHQFRRPIASFGAIQKKLADMAAGIFAGESMAFRVIGAMDALLATSRKEGDSSEVSSLAAAEELAVECSILKVYNTELLHVVADEAVQIHGGYGFSAEYPVERIYRDNRVNRIFEGTNEINRMLIPGMVFKRAMKGQLDVFTAIQSMEEALSSPPPTLSGAPLADAIILTEQSKRLALLIANTAIQKYMTTLREQQQVLLTLADLFTEVFALDSIAGRLKQLESSEGEIDALRGGLASLFGVESHRRVLRMARDIAPSLAKGEGLTELRGKIEHFAVSLDMDLIQLRRDIAQHYID